MTHQEFLTVKTSSTPRMITFLTEGKYQIFISPDNVNKVYFWHKDNIAVGKRIELVDMDFIVRKEELPKTLWVYSSTNEIFFIHKINAFNNNDIRMEINKQN
jgi:hypothetical protein